MRNPVWKPLEVLWRHQWAVVGSLAGTAFLLGIVGRIGDADGRDPVCSHRTRF